MTELTLSHVAHRTRAYPGETITLFTRVETDSDLPGLTTRLGLPAGLELGSYRASAAHGDGLPQIVFSNADRYVIWTLDGPITAGTRVEYEVDLTIEPTDRDVLFECDAAVVALNTERPIAVRETAAVLVEAKGRFLKYLPAVYTDYDEFMGRFLMLFESFWSPIEQQIDHLSHYFDSRYVPADLLPWLATWVNLSLDERWPEHKRRRLLRHIVSLYHRRGTKRGLENYLEIYTDRTPHIVEQRANDFRLGKSARLGPSVALGKLNQPHHFVVHLKLPPVHAADESEQQRLETERRRTIEEIIHAEKPAHTTYTLNLEVEQEEHKT